MPVTSQWLPPLGSPNLPLLHAALPLGADGAVHERALVLHTPDGARLSATVFEPDGAPRAVAVLAPATGVPQGFYRPFARWMAARGYAVLTLDYRGMGRSRGPEGRERAVSMRDWMLSDLPTAFREARRRATIHGNPLPLLWIGHSLGGHALPVLDGIEHLDGVVCIGSQLPAFRHWQAGWRRWGARFFFSRWVPGWVALTGRLPAVALGGGVPIPGPAAQDWSRWGQMEHYFASDPAMRDHWRTERFRGVAHLWCVADDFAFGPASAVQALADAFAQAPGRVQVQHLHPMAVGLRQIGHFGAFRRSGQHRVWPLVLEHLEAQVPALRPAQ